jgi:hypothetical protein
LTAQSNNYNALWILNYTVNQTNKTQSTEAKQISKNIVDGDRGAAEW